jgi:hypothetical protein
LETLTTRQGSPAKWHTSDCAARSSVWPKGERLTTGVVSVLRRTTSGGGNERVSTVASRSNVPPASKARARIRRPWKSVPASKLHVKGASRASQIGRG